MHFYLLHFSQKLCLHIAEMGYYESILNLYKNGPQTTADSSLLSVQFMKAAHSAKNKLASI